MSGADKVFKLLCDEGQWLSYFPAERKVRFVKKPTTVLSYRWDPMAVAHSMNTAWPEVLEKLATTGECDVADTPFTKKLEQLSKWGDVWIDQLCVPQGHGDRTMQLVKQCSALYATTTVVLLTADVKRLFNDGKIEDAAALTTECAKLAEGFQRGWIIRETYPRAKLNKDDIDFFWKIYNHHVGGGARDTMKHLLVIIEVAKGMQGKTAIDGLEQAATLYRVSSAGFTVEDDRQLVLGLLQSEGKLSQKLQGPMLKLIGAPLEAADAMGAFEEVKAIVEGDATRVHRVVKTYMDLTWKLNDKYHGQDWWFPTELKDGSGDGHYFLVKLVGKKQWHLADWMKFGYGAHVRYHEIVTAKNGTVQWAPPKPAVSGPMPGKHHVRIKCREPMMAYLHADGGRLGCGHVIETLRGTMWREDAVADGWFRLVVLHTGLPDQRSDALVLHVTEDGQIALGDMPATDDGALWKWEGEQAWKSLALKRDPTMRLCVEKESAEGGVLTVRKVEKGMPWSCNFTKVKIFPLDEDADI